MKVRDVMTETPIELSTEDTAQQAAEVMDEHDIGVVLVSDEDGHLRGLVTDRDLTLRCLTSHAVDPRRMKLGDVCTEALIRVAADDELDTAVEKMRTKRVRRLPVCDGPSVVGIVSLGDLAQERDPTSVLGRISMAPPNN